MNFEEIQKEIESLTDNIATRGSQEDTIKFFLDKFKIIMAHYGFTWTFNAMKNIGESTEVISYGGAVEENELEQEMRMALLAPRKIMNIYDNTASPFEAIQFALDIKSMTDELVSKKKKELLQDMPEELIDLLKSLGENDDD